MFYQHFRYLNEFVIFKFPAILKRIFNLLVFVTNADIKEDGMFPLKRLILACLFHIKTLFTKIFIIFSGGQEL